MRHPKPPDPNMQAMHGILTGQPPRLGGQVAELFKAMDSEIGRLRTRIHALEAAIEPVSEMLRKSLDYELSKRGLEVIRHNNLVAKSCEVSAWEQFKHKYNV